MLEAIVKMTGTERHIFYPRRYCARGIVIIVDELTQNIVAHLELSQLEVLATSGFCLILSNMKGDRLRDRTESQN
jgi:hypothetical protein